MVCVAEKDKLIREMEQDCQTRSCVDFAGEARNLPILILSTVAIIKPFFFLLIFGFPMVRARGQQKATAPVGRDTVFLRVDSLKAALVTAVMRPKLKGDTLEYNTEHLRMQPNAEVEELLRRLPGLHIDPDGTITYKIGRAHV